MNLYFYTSKFLAPLLLPSNFLFLSLVVFFYLGILRNRKNFKKIFYIFFITFSSISLFPIGENLIFHSLEKNYKDAKIPKNIDYIFVPGGDDMRIIQAIKLKNQYFPTKVKIIYSGGSGLLDKNTQDKGTLFVQTTIKNLNIDKKDIIFLPDSRNTIENFKQLERYLAKGRNKKILLVTSAFHMKRSLIIAKKKNIEAYGYPSNFYTGNYFSLIDYYQMIDISRNLFYFNVFFKELVGIFVAKTII